MHASAHETAEGYREGGDAVAVAVLPAQDAVPILRVGMWLFVSTVAMLFAAFTSSYLVRSGGAGWRDLTLPGILWPNTLVLIASSIFLEFARHAERRGDRPAVQRQVVMAGVMAILFLTGQWTAWQQLQGAGVYLSSDPHSSFFFLLTGVHAVHLLAGIAVLGSMAVRLQGVEADSRFEKGGTREPLAACAVYWHSITILWAYVFVLLLAS